MRPLFFWEGRKEMTKEEALVMLDSAPNGDKPSKVNPALSESRALKIVRVAIESYPPGKILNDLTEKRVYQVCRNQRRPRY